jgi:hypothetical protein
LQLFGAEYFVSQFAIQNLKIKIYNIIILPVVLYGCETWSLTLRLRMFENRVLRRIYWPKWDEVIMDWRKLHNKGLNDLYSSPSIVWVMNSRTVGWAGNVALMVDRRGINRFWVENPEGKRPLGRPRCRWKDNIKMDFQEVGLGVWTG